MGYARRPPTRCVLAKGSPLNEIAPESDRSSPRAAWLLLAGALVGLGLATLGLLEERRDAQRLPPDAAARVGERIIRRVDYLRVLAGVENDLRSPIDEAMRRRVLDRMIDEELLVQRALELGLAAIDRRVRGELTSGLIDSIVAEVDAEEPSAREVERHYDENVDFFTRPGRLRAQTLFFSRRNDETDPRGPARERADQALARLRAGEPVAGVERELADRQVSPIPDVLLPPSKVRDYAGPSVLQTLAGLEVGVWSEPIATSGGLTLARAVEREPPVVPALADVEELVRQDLKRRQGDASLRRYLDDLRRETPVAIDEGLFAAVSKDDDTVR